jgi:hypothetical protein
LGAATPTGHVDVIILSLQPSVMKWAALEP